MRIAIIATVRTGGKQLSKWVSEELGYHLHHEPEEGGYVGGFNIVVKYLVDSVVKSNIEIHNHFDPALWDKIITLKRNDVRRAAESFTFAQQYNLYHQHYSITNKWIRENEQTINENEVFIGRGNEIIDKIEFAGLKLTYEGIYETGEEIPILKDYLGITEPQYEWMLDKTYKYRTNPNQI